MGEETSFEKLLMMFSATLENMAPLPCIQSQAFILGCYVYLDTGSFSLVSKTCLLMCFPLVCDLALGSSVIIAVNFLFHANTSARPVLLP